MKNTRVLQSNILVVDPDIEDLNVSLDGDLRYVGDEAELSSYVQVDYKNLIIHIKLLMKAQMKIF